MYFYVLPEKCVHASYPNDKIPSLLPGDKYYNNNNIIIVVTDIHYHVCMNTHAYMYILLHTKSSYVAEGRNSLEHYTYTLHLDTDKITVYVGACTCVHVRT